LLVGLLKVEGDIKGERVYTREELEKKLDERLSMRVIF
jgi:hypothetical protein